MWSLTAGFRVPGTVLELANRLLPHIATGVQPATSVRPGRDAVTEVGDDALESAVRAALDEPGSVGVIAPDARAGEIAARLAAAGVAAADLAADDDARVTVVPTSQAKGLEYDTVVLVDPVAMVAAEPARADGLRRLYVALTRAVSRLVLVTDAGLPDELAPPSIV